MPEPRIIFDDRRMPTKFTERLSCVLIAIAGLGAAWVLTDPVVSLILPSGTTIKIGGAFSADLKGMIIGQILISGFAAVIGYWLGASAGSLKTTETIGRIAEQSAPVAAAAVAAAATAPLQAEDVTVEASGDVNVERK